MTGESINRIIREVGEESDMRLRFERRRAIRMGLDWRKVLRRYQIARLEHLDREALERR